MIENPWKGKSFFCPSGFLSLAHYPMRFFTMSPNMAQTWPHARLRERLPLGVMLYTTVRPRFSDFIMPRRFSSFSAGYIVPGVGFAPFRFPISLAICWPWTGFCARIQSIRNESMPRMSQPQLHPLPRMAYN